MMYVVKIRDIDYIRSRILAACDATLKEYSVFVGVDYTVEPTRKGASG